MKPNLIIRASAGTGKTFSLATRFIRLMLFQNVEPKSIVALTFSRAAAKEIYTKLLERLWKAALTDEGAATERDLLMQGLSAADAEAVAKLGIRFTRERFGELLRQTVDSQEVGAIATLDSFILRIVRSFPLEMGFQHAVEVLDEFGEKSAVQRVGDELLSADEEGEQRERLATAFRNSQPGEFRCACQSAFEKVLGEWHRFLVDHPEAKEWTADSMCAALGIPVGLSRPSTDGLSATGNNAAYFDKFCALLAGYDGEGTIFPDNKLGEMMHFFESEPEATVWMYDTGRGSHKICDVGTAGAAAIREGIRWMVAKALRRQLEVVAAKLEICRLFERDYDVSTRRRGQLTFSDFTHCQALSEAGENSLAIENIQYRFDERFTHWALDEFQDTSKLQWKCLERLVSEAASGEQRSVMVVGDLKQSIYGWRGGDDGPFRQIMAMGEFRGERGESIKNDISYRYGRHTVDFINRVFGPGNLKDSPLLNGACAAAVDYWLDEGCWMEHKAEAHRDKDYVEIVRVAKSPNADEAIDGGQDGAASADDDDDGTRCCAAMKILAPKLCELVKGLWQRHELTQNGQPSTDTIGILVRNNADGAYLAERIRAIPGAEIPVVWEGANGILDMPVVQAVLELLKLAAHPEDTFAWTAVDQLFPVRRLVFPELLTCKAVSRKVCEMLTRLGLSRTLRAVVSKLTVREAGLSARSIAGLEAVVRLAVAFEAREDGGAAFERFPQFLAVSAGRESGDSSRVVRILTIHRSKGLTLDHVIVPILESGTQGSICKPDRRQQFEGEGWALGKPSQELARHNPILSRVWDEKASEHLMEQLRLNYVALTRARKSTYVFVVDDKHDSAVQFRDLLLAPFASNPQLSTLNSQLYGEIVFADGTPFNFGYPKPDDSSKVVTEPWVHEPGVSSVGHRTPSAAGSALAVTHSVKSMASFFNRDFGKAVQKGSDVHAEYARIEWIDPSAPKDEREKRILSNEFRAAFVKPSSEASVWCERSYELYDEVENKWETGQFDRVVFIGEGESRSAVIYDFKTNGRHSDESEAAFAERLCRLYAPQMEAYRRALNRLTKIPPERIEARLLLEATGQSIPIPECAGNARTNGVA